MTRLIKRERAVAATLEAFGGKLLDFKSRDCVRMVKYSLHHRGLGVPLLKGLRYRTEEGAGRALEKLGLSGLDDGVDRAGLTRIPPALAWIGDIVALPAPAPFAASLMIYVGNGRLFGVAPGERRFAVIEPAEFLAAWRTPDDG